MGIVRFDKIAVSDGGQLATSELERVLPRDVERPVSVAVTFVPASPNQTLRGRPAGAFNQPKPGCELVATVAMPSPNDLATSWSVQADDHPPQTIKVTVHHAPPA